MSNSIEKGTILYKPNSYSLNPTPYIVVAVGEDHIVVIQEDKSNRTYYDQADYVVLSSEYGKSRWNVMGGYHTGIWFENKIDALDEQIRMLQQDIIDYQARIVTKKRDLELLQKRREG